MIFVSITVLSCLRYVCLCSSYDDPLSVACCLKMRRRDLAWRCGFKKVWIHESLASEPF